MSTARAVTRAFVALACALAFMALPVEAHEVRPGFIGFTETAPGTYLVVWTQPVAGGLRLALVPILPDRCGSR